MVHFSVRRATVAAIALACACNAGKAASPTSTGSGPLGPAEGADAGAAAEASTDGAGSDDSSPTGFPTDAHVVAESCTATGTCPPSAARVFASGLASPGGIVLDATDVYWVDVGVFIDAGTGADGGRVGSQILKCPKTGCTGLATIVAFDAGGALSKLAVDATSVYWIANGEILSCPLSGCTGSPSVFWSGSGTPYDIAADATGVYFTVPSAMQMSWCPAAGCGLSPTVLWPRADGSFGGNASAIALDGTSLYFVVAGNEVWACTESSCAATMHLVASPVVSTFSLVQLAVDAQNVYANEASSNGNGRLFVAPKSGQSQTFQVLLMGLTSPVGLAADGTDVFFAEDGTGEAGVSGFGRIGSCPGAGCAGGARFIADYLNFPLGIAVDATSVYWTDYGPGTDPTGTTQGRVMVWKK
jgi:hypothetical protein